MNSFVLIDDDVGWCLRDDSVVEIGKVDKKTDVVVKGKEVSTVVWTSGDISDIDWKLMSYIEYVKS